LDVGSGNGNFLKVANDLGFSVTGIEIDPSAVEVSRKLGFDVKVGSLPDTGLASGVFDHITLNHVIEHLHDPQAGLHEIYRLLKHGGRLWLQYPNVDSRGHELYGPAWRGLEPPRHVVMPSLNGIKRMLDNAGFTGLELLKPIGDVEGYFEQSDKIRSTMELAESGKGPIPDAAWSEAETIERKNPEKREHLTLIVYKA
jgi:SAM-dependent methyltransferase